MENLDYHGIWVSACKAAGCRGSFESRRVNQSSSLIKEKDSMAEHMLGSSRREELGRPDGVEREQIFFFSSRLFICFLSIPSVLPKEM